MATPSLRKYQNSLAISGLAVIALSIWSAIKDLLFVVLNTEEVRATMGESADASFGILLAGTLIALAIFLAISIFVGMSAYREGTGKKRGHVYIVLGVIIAVLLAAGLVTDFASLVHAFTAEEVQGSGDVHATSMLLDLAALSAIIEMLVSAWHVKKAERAIPRIEA